jgi:hypothetical protein
MINSEKNPCKGMNLEVLDAVRVLYLSTRECVKNNTYYF